MNNIRKMTGFSVIDVDELYYINGGCGNEGEKTTSVTSELSAGVTVDSDGKVTPTISVDIKYSK